MTVTRLPIENRMKQHLRAQQRSAIEARILPRLLHPETRKLCSIRYDGNFWLSIFPREGQDKFALRRVLAELEDNDLVCNSTVFHNELRTQLRFGWRDALHPE